MIAHNLIIWTFRWLGSLLKKWWFWFLLWLRHYARTVFKICVWWTLVLVEVLVNNIFIFIYCLVILRIVTRKCLIIFIILARFYFILLPKFISDSFISLVTHVSEWPYTLLLEKMVFVITFLNLRAILILLNEKMRFFNVFSRHIFVIQNILTLLIKFFPVIFIFYL